MKKFDPNFIFLLALALLFVPLFVFAQFQKTEDQKTVNEILPTEKDFIEMWEDEIRNDPETVIFEKIEEGKYYFKTNRFSFDGELKLFDVYLGYGYTDYLCRDEYIAAEIKLKLADVPESRFYYEDYGIDGAIKKEYRNDKNVKAYLDWHQDNCCSFYYDYQTEKWLTYDEHEKMKCREKEQEYLFGPQKFLLEFIMIPIIVLLILLILIINPFNIRRWLK